MIDMSGPQMKSYHYPPYTAPWGRATKEPTHVWSDTLHRSVPRKRGACTNPACPFCTYLTHDDKGLPVRRRYDQ